MVFNRTRRRFAQAPRSVRREVRRRGGWPSGHPGFFKRRHGIAAFSPGFIEKLYLISVYNFML